MYSHEKCRAVAPIGCKPLNSRGVSQIQFALGLNSAEARISDLMSVLSMDDLEEGFVYRSIAHFIRKGARDSVLFLVLSEVSSSLAGVTWLFCMG